jgi:ABC-type transporter Mla subunit MlaD
MPQRASWKNLWIGVASASAVLATALLILIFGRVGIIHGKKITLYIATDVARGVIRGTTVWLDGQPIGSVRGIEFRPPSVPASERLVLKIRVLSRTRDRIRRDSRIQIRAGASILGEPVVYVHSGTARQPAVREGDTLFAPKQTDVQNLTSEFGTAAREFPAILQNLALLSAQLQSTEGTLGAFRLGDGANLTGVRRHVSRVKRLVTESDGSVALFRSDADEFHDRAQRALAQVDSVRSLFTSTKHSFGRFRRDSSIITQVKAIRTELGDVAKLASATQGTVGRVRGDSAIIRGVHRSMAGMDSLMADMKKHPFRYIAF